LTLAAAQLGEGIPGLVLLETPGFSGLHQAFPRERFLV